MRGMRVLEKIPLWAAVVVFWGLLLVAFGNVQAGEGSKYFRIRSEGCDGALPLDFEALLKSTGGMGGRVEVRASLDTTGKVVGAKYLVKSERSGPEPFWHEVERVVQTWCYSRGAVSRDCFLTFLVVVYPVDRGGGGFIEIDLTGLRLKPGWVVDTGRPAELVRIENLDEGNVIVSEALSQFVGIGPQNAWGTVKKIWGQLGWGFQIVFISLTVGLVAAILGVAVRGAKPWVRPPLYKRLFGKGGRRYSYNKGEYPRDLGSGDAQVVRELWELAIRRSHFDADSLPEVNPDTIKKLEDLNNFATADSRSSVEILERAKGLGLVGQNAVLADGDFVKTREPEVAVPQKTTLSVDEAKTRAAEILDRKLGPSELMQVGGELQKCKRVADVEKILERYGLSLETQAAPPVAEGELKQASEIRRMIAERLEWSRLYSVFGNKGWAGLSDEDVSHLRHLTWEGWCRGLVETALKEAEKRAEQGFELFDVFVAGLSNHLANRNEWYASQEIDRAVDRALADKVDTRRSNLDSLWAIGAIAPLVGLFGTVWGISKAFAKIQGIHEAELRMAKLAGDINIALSTTIAGLIIGIVAFVSYYAFKDRIERQASAVSNYFIRITNLL